MANHYSELMFTPAVKRWQEADGSRASYARREVGKQTTHDRLTMREAEFIAARDSFYMASVSETGWPYLQHRGGPPGFLTVLNERTLSFPDYPGNRQFISFGNIAGEDRVSLFLMNYPNQHRLKVLGHATIAKDGTEEDSSGRRRVTIAVEAFDWNCPQYITPRYSLDELDPVRARLGSLEAENVELRSRLAATGHPGLRPVD
jgi:predicted pyridoxine 5'-phosphate oxidase superfamily flavin-nucleotide-binding protein